MDPDATLNDLRNLIDAFDVTPYSEDAAAVADSAIEKFKALDTWLVSGGFLPTAWDLAINSRNRFGAAPVEDNHEEIWCERCAKGEHSFFDQNGRPVENCNCCGEEKS